MADQYMNLNGRFLNVTKRIVYPPGTTWAQVQSQEAAAAKAGQANSTVEAVKQAVSTPAATQTAPTSEPVNAPVQPAAPSAAPPAAIPPLAASQQLVASDSPTSITPIAELMSNAITGEAAKGSRLRKAFDEDAPVSWGNGGLVVDPLWRGSGGGSVVS